jgi:glycosyltransferase involved in cell wall biosynthesis
MIITPTEAVRRQVLNLFQVARQRVCTIPEAASPHLRPVLRREGGRPYFLFVGTLEPRKNVTILINAMRIVRQRFDVDLVIAGRRRQDAPIIPHEPGLVLQGEVPENELAGLYSGAVACVYPSLYEGFGLPVLEAMQCGAAVIASRDPALLEVSGGAAIHVDATDVRGWSQAMLGLLENPEELQRRRQMGLQRADCFSWTRTAQLTREVYAEAIGQFRR